MKLNLILSAALIAGVISASAVTAPPATTTGTNSATSPEAAMKALFGDPTIVKGTGFEIKQSELDQVLTGAKANAAAQGQQLPPEFTVAILNQLITIQTLLQKATDADRVAGKAESDLQYTNLLKRFGSQEAFERQLKAVGMTVADLRAKAEQEAVAKATLKRELHITVTDEDAKAFYLKHTADFEQPEKVHVRHLLLMTIDPATGIALPTNSVVAKHKQIEDLRKQILGGADFAALAKQYSDDKATADKGGDAGTIREDALVPTIRDTLAGMPEKSITEVLHLPDGYHIIRLLGVQPPAPASLDQARPQIVNSLRQARMQQALKTYVDQLLAAQPIALNEIDLARQVNAQH